jgi:hypothetical protein
MTHVRKVHLEGCSKTICKHLARFMHRMKDLIDNSQMQKRRTIGVRLHNIREIEITNSHRENNEDILSR